MRAMLSRIFLRRSASCLVTGGSFAGGRFADDTRTGVLMSTSDELQDFVDAIGRDAPHTRRTGVAHSEEELVPKPTRTQRPVLALLSVVALAVLAAIALVPAVGGSKANAEPLLSGDPSFSRTP